MINSKRAARQLQVAAGVHAVAPRVGLVLLHDVDVVHAAPPLRGGTKYLLRAEVVIRAAPH
jgi:hypothetical protein